MTTLPLIPRECEALWAQLKNGPVTVHEQEVGKASDIRKLFDLGLIRVTTGETTMWPAKVLVLSELGHDVVLAQKNN